MRERDENNKKRMTECVSVNTEEGKAVIKDEIIVKMIRTPTGGKIGPGTYEGSIAHREQKSYNIMGMAAEITKEGKKRSLSREAEKPSRNRSLTETPKRSFSRTQKKIESDKVPAKGWSPGKASTLKLSRTDRLNRNLFLMTEGYEEQCAVPNKKNKTFEFFVSQKREQREKELGTSVKNLENMKRIIQESQAKNRNNEDVLDGSLMNNMTQGQ